MPDLARLFRRDCVTCPSTQPACNCSDNQRCIVTVKTCSQCPEARCESVDTSDGSVSSKSAGAIAGGVVGGLVGIGLVIGFLLWYKFRHHRARKLQTLEEANLQYKSPPESLNYDHPVHERKTPSIISTYGGASRRSNVIPIMFPFHQANDTESTSNINRNLPLHDGSIINLTNNRDSESAIPLNEGQLTLRDSIRDSEYSMQIDNPLSVPAQGLRAYDVAVQGIPNLIDVGRQRKRAPLPRNLRRISESGSQSPAEEPEPEIASLTSRRAQRWSLASAHSIFDPLPEINDPPSQLDISQLQRLNITQVQSGDVESISPFDDSASEQPRVPGGQRFSVASSNAYSAHLPEDAKIYQGNGLL